MNALVSCPPGFSGLLGVSGDVKCVLRSKSAFGFSTPVHWVTLLLYLSPAPSIRKILCWCGHALLVTSLNEAAWGKITLEPRPCAMYPNLSLRSKATQLMLRASWNIWTAQLFLLLTLTLLSTGLAEQSLRLDRGQRPILRLSLLPFHFFLVLKLFCYGLNVSPTNFLCWNQTPKVMVLGGGA